MKRFLLAVAVSGLALPAFAANDIFRCQTRQGGVSYQQGPCEDDSLGGPSGIAAEYPPVNTAERDRIFEREAAMYQRLEAQRERLSKEAMVRTATAAPAPEPAVEMIPVIVGARPYRPWNRVHSYHGTVLR